MSKSRRNYSKLRSKKAKRINKTRRYKTKRINKTRRYKTKRINKTKRRYSKQSRRLRKNNKTKKKSKKIIGGAYPLSLFNGLTIIQGLLGDGMVLRLVRHGIPNSKSGIAAFGGFSNLSAREYLEWGTRSFLKYLGYEPTLYFDDKLKTVEVSEVGEHRKTKAGDKAVTDIYKTSLFHFPVSLTEEPTGQINLVVFVSPFLRTLETMLEMMSSAIITIRKGRGQADRGFKITVIIGPFTEIRSWKDQTYGNYYHPTTITRFLELVHDFKDIYLNDGNVKVDFDLLVCNGDSLKNLLLTQLLTIRQTEELKKFVSGSIASRAEEMFNSFMRSKIYQVDKNNTQAGQEMDLFKCLERVLQLELKYDFEIEALNMILKIIRDFEEELEVKPDFKMKLEVIHGFEITGSSNLLITKSNYQKLYNDFSAKLRNLEGKLERDDEKVLNLVKTDHFNECRVVTHSNRLKQLFTHNTTDNPSDKVGYLESVLIGNVSKSGYTTSVTDLETKTGYKISHFRLETKVLQCNNQLKQLFLPTGKHLLSNTPKGEGE